MLAQAEGSLHDSMLSEVSGMDNSLSLAEIDRIIGNLIGQEADSFKEDEDLTQSYASEMLSPHGPGGDHSLVPDSTNVSAHFEEIPTIKQSPIAQRGGPPPGVSFLSPAAQRLLSPQSQATPSPGVEPLHDSPTDVPSYFSPPPLPARR